MIRLAMVMGALALTACANAPEAAPAPRAAVSPDLAPDLAYGQRIAARSCGGCHAVAEGASAEGGAPPFRDLYRRYPPGGLAQLLEEGMLPSDRPPEEGARPMHPRMPTVSLDVDEVAALTAYLRSLDPRP